MSVNDPCTGELVEPPTVYVVKDNVLYEYTEVDYGNLDDEAEVDDGLNIFPPVIGRLPTAAETAKSASLNVAPTTEVTADTTPAPPATTPPTACIDVPASPPDNFQLSTNFVLSDLSSKTVLSKNRVTASAGLSVQDIVCNLQAHAQNICEPLAAAYGRSNMTITSGFRLGGGSSQHDKGQATDIQFLGKSNSEVYAIAVFVRDNLPYDQLILEYGGNRPWIHCSFNRAGNRPSSASNKFGTRVSAGSYVWGTLKDMS
jgi:hypothetical protein